MRCMKSTNNFAERKKAHLVMIFVQLTYAGMAMFSKAAVSTGMRPSVFVAYRQAFATLTLLPLSFLIDRKVADPLSGRLLVKIFFVSLIGITLSLNLYMYSIQFVSATLASASVNSIPALTFLIAVIFRVERCSVRNSAGILKILGTGLTLSGAMVFAFTKGPQLTFLKLPHHHHHHHYKTSGTDVNSRHVKWVQGSLLMLAANATWAFWLVMQAYLVKQYPAKMRLMLVESVCSCLQSTVWGMAIERNMSSWRPKLDTNLLFVAYCGVIITGIGYWMQLWAVENKGPLFTVTFTPLALVMTAVFSALVWNETLHLGSLCGGVLLVGGLYCVLWGKSKEPKKEQQHGDKVDEDEEDKEGVVDKNESKNQDNNVVKSLV